jgi:hypothetical protein
MVLAESSVARLYCPRCSQNVDSERNDRVWDNGWVLELDLDVLRAHAKSMGIESRKEVYAGGLEEDEGPRIKR